MSNYATNEPTLSCANVTTESPAEIVANSAADVSAYIKADKTLPHRAANKSASKFSHKQS